MEFQLETKMFKKVRQKKNKKWQKSKKTETNVLKSKFKFQVFPDSHDRKTNLSVRFLGEVMAQQFCFEVY